MLASSPNTEYVSYRAPRRDHSVSPSCRLPFNLQTPPRFARNLAHDSPMLTPSPLRRHELPSAEPMDMDDIFQSPAGPASQSYQLRMDHSTRFPPRPSPHDDEDDCDESSLFMPSSSFSVSRNLAPPTSPLPLRTPLRTPVKQTPRHLGTPERPVLTIKPLNTLTAISPERGAGAKRKPTPSFCATPLRTRTMTPLNITSSAAQKLGDSAAGFDRLAPLPAPRFNPRTPQTKAETDLHLKRQAETMTLLKISDLHRTDDESGYDSGLEVGNAHGLGQRLMFGVGGPSTTPYSAKKTKGKVKATGPTKSPAVEIFIRRGQINNEEVAEAISPGGHVTKRRARSRPVSAELLESSHNTSTLFENQVKTAPHIYESKSASSVAFPSTRVRRTSDSSTSSLETGSPVLYRRLTSGALPRMRTQSHSSQTRTALNRMASVSSATLFFGPAIPDLKSAMNTSNQSNLTASGSPHGMSNGTARGNSNRSVGEHPKMSGRHSYGGQGVSAHSPWVLSATPSPLSSPNSRKRPEESSDDEDLFFSGPADTSFAFTVTEGTPSPMKKQKRDMPSPLPKKFRPRDSGIAFDSSDDERGLRLLHGDDLFMPSMPRASTSVSTVNSEGEDQALVTPGFGPSVGSGWPGADPNIASLSDESADDIDAFILRTLAAGASKSATGHDEPKRIPGTPVKKIKTAHLGQRPWQSAVASKIGFPGFDDDLPGGAKGGKGKGKPRKSLPAAFPVLGKENRAARKQRIGGGADKIAIDVDAEGEDEELSPVARRDSRYDGLGLGRPSGVIPAFTRPSGDSKGVKAHWLMRRSSSGAFSSGSETVGSNNATPTRNSAKVWGLPPPRIPAPVSPLKNRLDFSDDRATPSSSSISSTVLNSPSAAATSRHFLTGASALPQPTPMRAPVFARPQTHAHPSRLPFGHPSPPKTTGARGRASLSSGEERPGRFEREFIEVDELGTGEFGRVMKVRFKDDLVSAKVKDREYFAVKKSKRFEGAKHRLRLREEVDILAHLSGRGGHPNVLAYVDSWEEEETLYIRTELCALGNFAHFLAAYGRSYPKLDEGRVWRILAELSAGLHFVHDASVIHLDLKPANIFITASGRLKIGDFGMASLWPRPTPVDPSMDGYAFEREGDKLYLAPEVLQGRYGKAADVFSLGMMILETATNVVIPDQGESWHRLRREDFSQADCGLESLSPELRDLLRCMMRKEPAVRIEIGFVATHPVVSRAREAMENVRATEGDVFAASPLGGVGRDFLQAILHRHDWPRDDMDVGL